MPSAVLSTHRSQLFDAADDAMMVTDKKRRRRGVRCLLRPTNWALLQACSEVAVWPSCEPGVLGRYGAWSGTPLHSHLTGKGPGTLPYTQGCSAWGGARPGPVLPGDLAPL